MRKLSKDFMDSLRSGILEPILAGVKNDFTLCLEIRKDCINIYYRGGNIMKVEYRNKSFSAYFDRKYSGKAFDKLQLPEVLREKKDVKQWLEKFPILKQSMDLWFSKHKHNERELQQAIVRENNFDVTARSTDYFICDVEYKEQKGRFDLIAVNWPSSSRKRKNNKNLGIAFIELKYYDDALRGETSGVIDHIKDINEFLSNPKNLKNIKSEMKTVFNQKRNLGLIKSKKDVESFSNEKPEYIFIFANHDPDSSILHKELKTLEELVKDIKFEEKTELKFAVSNFMGCGIYRENVFNFNDFCGRFAKQIYSKKLL